MPNEVRVHRITHRVRFAPLCPLLAALHFLDMNRRSIALLFVVCTACVEKPPATGLPQQVIPAKITSSDSDLQPGETTTLTVTLENTLEEDVRLTFPSSCQYLIFIRDSAGRVTTPENGTWECAPVPSSLSIRAGETATYNLQWGGGIEFGAAGTSTRVPAGSYQAWAELRSDGYHAIAFPITIVVR